MQTVWFVDKDRIQANCKLSDNVFWRIWIPNMWDNGIDLFDISWKKSQVTFLILLTCLKNLISGRSRHLKEFEDP